MASFWRAVRRSTRCGWRVPTAPAAEHGSAHLPVGVAGLGARDRYCARNGTCGALVLDTSRTVKLGNDERVLMRRTLCLLFPIFGMGLVLSACSSSQQATSPRSACSLLSAKEASAAFGGPVQPPNQCQVEPGDQSSGLYGSGGTEPGILLVHVSWSKEAVTTFTVSHSGHAHYAAGFTPPVYSRVTVAGISAYWQLSPSPITVKNTGNNSGPAVSNLRIITLKNGYVVTLDSMSLSQSQDEQALASIISRL